MIDVFMTFKNRFTILAGLLLLSLFLTLTPQVSLAVNSANVKLTDKTDGQEKSLNDIDDLAKATGAIFPSFKADSLLMFYKNGDSMQAEAVKIDYRNAARNVIGSFKSDFNPDYTAGLFPVTTDADAFGSRTVYLPTVSGASNAATQSALKVKLSNDTLIGSTVDSFSLTFGENGLVTDAKGNLRVSGDRKLIVISGLRRDNGSRLKTIETDDYTKTYATGSLKFFVMSGDKLTPIDCAGIPTFSTVGTMPSFRIAVGDLNNDGSPSEVAVVTGSREDEYYHLYVYEITASGNAISAKEIFSEKTEGRRFVSPDGDDDVSKHIAGAFDKKYYGALSDAAALAVGDFNGDGEQELAMGFGDWQGTEAVVAMTIYKWDNNTFVSKTNKNIGYESDELTPRGGLITRVKQDTRDPARYSVLLGDITGHFLAFGTFGMNLACSTVGDKDVLTMQYFFLIPSKIDDSLYDYCPVHLPIVCEAHSIEPLLSSACSWYSPEFVREDSTGIGYATIFAPYHNNNMGLGYIKDDVFVPPINEYYRVYTPVRCSLAAGTFGGKDFNGRYCRAFSYRYANDSYVVVQMNTRNDDPFPHSRSDFREMRLKIDATQVGLLADDFYCESFIVGDPYHLRIEGRRSYVALLQVPPFHIDFIPALWKNDITPAVNNVTYSSETEVKYVHSTNASTEETVDFSQKYSQEIGTSMKVSVEASSPNFFGCEASASGSLQSSINAATSESESYTQGSQVSTTMTFSSSTNFCDDAVYYGSTMHVWRYPVLKPVHKDFRGQLALYDDPSMYENPTMFLTYTMCDEVAEHSGNPGIYYNATHEEGNIFSYPTTVKGIPCYDESKNQMTLGKPITKDALSTLEDSFEISKGFNEGQSHSSTSQLTASMAISAKASAKAMCVKTSVESDTKISTSSEMANTETFKKKFSDSEKISFKAPVSPYSKYAPYTLGSKLFIDEAGILTTGMYVSDIPEDGPVWNKYYSERPDPALVMPNKFTPVKLEWQALNDQWVARQIRGVRLKSSKGSIFNDNMLLVPGVEYVITVPIYNASFVPKNEPLTVPVKLSYQRYRQNETRKDIGIVDVKIAGWMATTERNKATAEFHWTVPKDISQAQYQFCVQLDPENKIDEIHEMWNFVNDPAGNNIGFVDFAVWDGGGVVDDNSANPRSLMNGGSSSENPLAFRRKSMNAADSSEGENASELDDSLSYITITHLDKMPLYNLHCMLGFNDKKEDGTSHFRIIGSWYVPAMFEGDSREFMINYPYEELIEAANEGKLEFIASNPAAKVTYTYSNEDLEQLAEAVEARVESGTGVSSSSGGCDAGLAGAGVLIALAFVVMKRR